MSICSSVQLTYSLQWKVATGLSHRCPREQKLQARRQRRVHTLQFACRGRLAAGRGHAYQSTLIEAWRPGRQPPQTRTHSVAFAPPFPGCGRGPDESSPNRYTCDCHSPAPIKQPPHRGLSKRREFELRPGGPPRTQTRNSAARTAEFGDRRPDEPHLAEKPRQSELSGPGQLVCGRAEIIPQRNRVSTLGRWRPDSAVAAGDIQHPQLLSGRVPHQIVGCAIMECASHRLCVVRNGASTDFVQLRGLAQ